MNVFDTEWVACGAHRRVLDVFCELEAGHDVEDPGDRHQAVYRPGIGVSWIEGARTARFTGPRSHLVRGRGR